MGYVLFGLGSICHIVGLVCFVLIVIDAFKNEVWKGLVCLMCTLYAVYFSFTEFDHEKQMPIAVGHLAFLVLGGALYKLASLML